MPICRVGERLRSIQRVNTREAESRLPPRWRIILGTTVLTLCGLTVLATWQSAAIIRENQESRLAYEAARTDVALEQRMQAYVQILRGAVGLFASSDEVTRSEWIEYVTTLRLGERYPGFKSLSFAPAVPDSELAAFVATVRQEPVPDGMVDPALLSNFTPRSPTGVRSETAIHAPILYVAPFTPENQIVLGVDMMQDPQRRAAMEAAASTDDAILTPRLRLAGQSDARAGFIAYTPVRAHGRLLGWLTAAFRAPDLISGLQDGLTSTVAIEISDGDGGLLYSSAPLNSDGSARSLRATSGLERYNSPQMPGRNWDVRYVAADGFATTTEQVTPWVVAGGGSLVTALVLVVGLTGAGWRSRAAELARQRAALSASEAVVRHQATHDSLTGLGNRALFTSRLADAIGGSPFSLAYIDIDDFKPVNDRFGHRVGDMLIKQIATRLSANVHPDDTVARIGGDEFVVILGARNGIDPTEMTVRLSLCLAEPYSLVVNETPHTIQVTASIGIARYPEDGTTPEQLIHVADTAMFADKRRRRLGSPQPGT